jgi:regulator of protease activity HflC (stomatin/prohibitin superfamily)
MQKAIKMDIKTQKYEADASAASKDLQVVSTKIAVNYRLSPESTPNLYQTVGLDYQNRIIQPAVQEVVKSATAKFTAEELITKRPEVKEEIEKLLKERLFGRNIIVEEISITNFDFSTSFNSAIEDKVTAEQNALAAKNKLEQIKYEAEQAVTAAKGQADSQALLAVSVNQDTLEYQRLLNERAAIDKWNGQLPSITGGVTPFVNFDLKTSTTTM